MPFPVAGIIEPLIFNEPLKDIGATTSIGVFEIPSIVLKYALSFAVIWSDVNDGAICPPTKVFEPVVANWPSFVAAFILLSIEAEN